MIYDIYVYTYRCATPALAVGSKCPANATTLRRCPKSWPVTGHEHPRCCEIGFRTGFWCFRIGFVRFIAATAVNCQINNTFVERHNCVRHEVRDDDSRTLQCVVFNPVSLIILALLHMQFL